MQACVQRHALTFTGIFLAHRESREDRPAAPAILFAHRHRRQDTAARDTGAIRVRQRIQFLVVLLHRFILLIHGQTGTGSRKAPPRSIGPMD